MCKCLHAPKSPELHYCPLTVVCCYNLLTNATSDFWAKDFVHWVHGSSVIHLASGRTATRNSANLPLWKPKLFAVGMEITFVHTHTHTKRDKPEKIPLKYPVLCQKLNLQSASWSLQRQLLGLPRLIHSDVFSRGKVILIWRLINKSKHLQRTQHKLRRLTLHISHCRFGLSFFSLILQRMVFKIPVHSSESRQINPEFQSAVQLQLNFC